MMQLWLLTIFYLVYTGLLLSTPYLGVRIPSLLNLRDFLFSHGKLIKVVAITGYIIGTCNLVFPLEPGPIVLGDLFPALFTFWSAIWYTFRIHKGEEGGQFGMDGEECKKYWRRAITLLSVAFLHFLLPFWVLL
jgi:hypothetical protein